MKRVYNFKKGGDDFFLQEKGVPYHERRNSREGGGVVSFVGGRKESHHLPEKRMV